MYDDRQLAEQQFAFQSTYFVTRKKHFNEGQAGSSSNSCGPKARSRRTGEQERKGGNGLGH